LPWFGASKIILSMYSSLSLTHTTPTPALETPGRDEKDECKESD